MGSVPYGPFEHIPHTPKVRRADLTTPLAHLPNPSECGHSWEFLSKFFELFARDGMAFATSAARANIANHAHESANRVAVHRVVDGAITDTDLRHVLHDLFESVQVLRRVAIEFDVADVASVGERMVRSFERKLLESRNLVVDRHVEGVGVVIAVGNARDNAKLLLVHAHEAAREAFSRRCKQAEVEAKAFGFLVAEFAHVADNFEAEFLGSFGFAMVLARKHHQGFCKADKAN